ncbi:helix-turn-helix transcriptional regulator [Actinoplanes sp. LDG1-01]|uniref:Helix-turn-helix transcriptional regulator n=2 Tax=Paractinoplanes lichenicola TaxID=2802976 RepID=A0ABS1VMV3_9ACTN|nr:helix-turn-helix transcriptional regulator [Actinoplanes lichenicola]
MLFAQRGFDDVTVAEIAEHAGVTSRTFFRYFPSKETVLLDIYDQTSSRVMQLIETVPTASTEVLPTLTEAVVRWCEEFGELFAALQPVADGSKTLTAALLIRATYWEDHLAEALCTRFPDLDPQDAKVWAYTTFAMMRLLQHNSVENGTSYADAARDVFGRLGLLTGGRKPRRTSSADRLAKRAG